MWTLCKYQTIYFQWCFQINSWIFLLKKAEFCLWELNSQPTEWEENLYIYISFVRVYVIELLPNGWVDFDEIFCVCSVGFKNGLDLQFGPIKIVYLINLSFINCCWFWNVSYWIRQTVLWSQYWYFRDGPLHYRQNVNNATPFFPDIF